jgi:hypothetical protein
MKLKLWIAGLSALATAALLIPVASAEAGYNTIPFCGNVSPSTGTAGTSPKVLTSGQTCSFFPVAVSSMRVDWDVTSSGNGSVCLGVVRYPPGWPNGTMLGITGAPGSPICHPVNSVTRFVNWNAYNGFNAVYGQPIVINYSTATIKTRPDRNGWLSYYY